LIVPVDKSQPNKAGGTSYNGTISSTISSIFNFDIPQSYSGKTCTLVFLLPQQDKLTTSAFSLSGSGGFDVARLSSPATEQTSFNTVPSVARDVGGPESVTPGNEYVIASSKCFAGRRSSYKVTATGSLDLNYFQDFNPSPIGFYITVC
jgi:glucan endo-1,3-beta-D-glucosidase